MVTFAVEEANSEKTDGTPVVIETAQSLAITDLPIPMTSDGCVTGKGEYWGRVESESGKDYSSHDEVR